MHLKCRIRILCGVFLIIIERKLYTVNFLNGKNILAILTI